MDRQKTDIGQCQAGFISILIKPFFDEVRIRPIHAHGALVLRAARPHAGATRARARARPWPTTLRVGRRAVDALPRRLEPSHLREHRVEHQDVEGAGRGGARAARGRAQGRAEARQPQPLEPERGGRPEDELMSRVTRRGRRDEARVLAARRRDAAVCAVLLGRGPSSRFGVTRVRVLFVCVPIARSMARRRRHAAMACVASLVASGDEDQMHP